MKHLEIAKAWLNGADVEVRGIHPPNWTLLTNVKDAPHCYAFGSDNEYRLKPKKQVVHVAVLLETQGNVSGSFSYQGNSREEVENHVNKFFENRNVGSKPLIWSYGIVEVEIPQQP